MKDERDIREKIRDGHYQPKGDFPTKPSTPRAPVGGSPDDYRKHAAALEAHAIALVEYQAKMRAYQEEDAKCCAAFDHDLLEHLGITGHPKAGKLCSMAYSRGHSSGMESVVSEAEELAELIRK